MNKGIFVWNLWYKKKDFKMETTNKTPKMENGNFLKKRREYLISDDISRSYEDVEAKGFKMVFWFLYLFACWVLVLTKYGEKWVDYLDSLATPGNRTE